MAPGDPLKALRLKRGEGTVVMRMVTHLAGCGGRLRRRLFFAGTTMAVLAIAPGAALAATPTQHQYGSSLQQLSQGGSGGLTGGGSASGTAATGSLPFTGLDLVLLASVAAALVIAGALLRRGRPESSRA